MKERDDAMWRARQEARKAAHSLAARFERLRGAAEAEHGAVTLALAARFGISAVALSRYERKAILHRTGRGVYRFADDFPTEGDEVRDALIECGSQAVASHETALRLHDLSDVNPGFIHVTIPRNKRYITTRRNIILHTVSVPIETDERMEVDGVMVTVPTRSIVDAARGGTQWEQIESAVREGIAGGIFSKEELRCALKRATRQARERIELQLKGIR